MPDADDFDVEYFRNLLQGKKPADRPAPPAKTSGTAAPKQTRPVRKPAAAAENKKPAAGRQKNKKR